VGKVGDKNIEVPDNYIELIEDYSKIIAEWYKERATNTKSNPQVQFRKLRN